MENIKVINKIRIKRKERQLLLRIVTGFLIFSILLNVGIAALYPQIVYASFAGTVAGYILTLFASFNCAITNPNVVGAINNTFGSMALEAADAGVIQQGLTQIAQTTGFDMTTIFSNTAAEAAQFAQAAGVEIETIASTAGQNLAAGATACAAAGGAVLPAIAGTVLPAAAAVGLGVAGGFLIDHIRNAITNYIRGGYQIDAPTTVVNNIPSGCNFIADGTSRYFCYDYDCRAAVAGGEDVFIRNYSNVTKGWSVITSSGASMGSSVAANSTQYVLNIWQNRDFYGQYIVNGLPKFSSSGECKTYLNGFNSGEGAPNRSPDIVGNTGNKTGVQDGDNYTINNINPIYNYGETIVQYISPTDYQTLIDQANDNTNDGDTGIDTQGQDFTDFVNPYVTPIDSTTDPDQPVDPETNLPYPQPTIAPTNPIIPVQPTPAPEPTLTPEDETEMPKGMVQPSLKDKFPFCIPFDIAYLFAVMSDEREAPQFVWTLDLGQWGEYEIEIDLSMFDSVAAIFRLCELILFILGLMLITKSLMSSNDGG